MDNPKHLSEADRKFAMVLAMSLEKRFGRRAPAILAAATTASLIIIEFPKTLRYIEKRKEGLGLKKPRLSRVLGRKVGG